MVLLSWFLVGFYHLFFFFLFFRFTKRHQQVADVRYRNAILCTIITTKRYKIKVTPHRFRGMQTKKLKKKKTSKEKDWKMGLISFHLNCHHLEFHPQLKSSLESLAPSYPENAGNSRVSLGDPSDKMSAVCRALYSTNHWKATNQPSRGMQGNGRALLRDLGD